MSESRPATVADLKRLIESLPDDMLLVNYEPYFSEEVEAVELGHLPQLLRIVDAHHNRDWEPRLYLFTAEYAKSRAAGALTISNERDVLWI